MAGARTTAMPYMAKPIPRCSGGKVSARMACSLGPNPPPPAPCRMRKKISMGRRGGESAEQRAEGEQQHAGHVEALAAKAVAGPGGDGQHDGVGDQVAGQHPGGFILPGGERSGDVGQGDVGDGGVQHLHEGGQSDRHGHGPGIVTGAPAGAGDRTALSLIEPSRPEPRRDRGAVCRPD